VKGYCENIEKRTIENQDFRRILYTGHHLQLVAMTLQPDVPDHDLADWMLEGLAMGEGR
jgi:hypothetical protein